MNLLRPRTQGLAVVFLLLAASFYLLNSVRPVSAGRLDELRAEKQRKLQEAAEKKKRAAEEERLKKEYEKQRVQIDGQIQQTEKAIVRTDQKISATTQAITVATNEIARLEGEIKALEGRLNELAAESYIYQMSPPTSQGLLAVVLGSQSLTDAIRQFQAFESIQIEFEGERDRYIATKQATERRRGELITLNHELEVQKQQKEFQKQALATQSEIKDRLAKTAAAEASRLSSEAQTALQKAGEIENVIAAEIRKLVAERRKNPAVTIPSATGGRVGQEVQAGDVIGYAGSTGFSTGTHVHASVFVNGEHRNPRDYMPGAIRWPLDDFEVSQEYGPTSITGFINRVYTFHNGIDLVPTDGYGAPVKAAKAGNIILDERYGGYGNAVVIDHGDGLMTLYGHMI